MSLIVILVVILLLVHLATVDGATSMSLISKSSIHHISLWNLSTAKDMSLITIHDYVVFLNYSDSAYLIIISLPLTLAYMLLWMLMVLLTLNYMPS